ncbi:MAG: hypothetical protein ACRDWV_03130 [Acidimicrobiales bacterium]
MRRRLVGFGLFWYDFVVGDDWRLAVGVVLALGLTATVASLTSMPAWWIAPVVALIVLVASTWRAARRPA